MLSQHKGVPEVSMALEICGLDKTVLYFPMIHLHAQFVLVTIGILTVAARQLLYWQTLQM